mmetsp:Transcript_35249/g.99762  ORF Transcript_35249/g.99762 Transcript_35249/m.99762 type:complete len:825 (-) Transcript_35249:144-2618(-)|eukprot:CAMPEP_0117657086 /NCGR_PEP_ID=MMETSP0804-20121206/5146_1 /TAXON_ID=1074897 /ORGANISM="Tetraselmis astigmatica, Strain CCMP880" /LENGTH=824 /DNA_ID=CAMNT_0005463523 /DNA_START=138 /DNA_END=2612 /DNA_ORIENTATION=-
MPASSTVKVVVRCKPKEDPTNDHLTAVDLPESPGNSTIILQKGPNPTEGLYQFNFTRVLNDKTQRDVYEVCGRGMVSAVLDGYNSTIMAYGQTGAGKTYTMTGPEGSLHDPEQRGIVPRLIHDIFADISRRRVQAVVTCSYIEIYNEHFRDLLNPDAEGNEIGITEMGKRVVLKGARQPQITSAEEAFKLLNQGESLRHVAGHGMNSRSSRSHTIFTMLVSSVTPSGKKLSAKLNLVDLAGSERANKTGVSGAAAREALYINKSLTFLEQVIVALAKRNVGHVPYRSSKLTHFLKDSLGGNCKTLLIANIWSSYSQINETISTCRFAHRMMQVTEDAHSNNDGFNSVHGNLFKLDPVMQGYLETVTAAAVAREKAKLMMQFQRHGYIGDENGPQLSSLSEHEREELNQLREKVAELEEMQEMTKMASEAARNGVVVDLETLEEMEMLRKRLLELEAENVVKSLDSPPRPATTSARQVADMEEELHALRQQVAQLQNRQRESPSESEEVERLRAQVREMQERELQRQAAAAAAPRDDELTEEEMQELLKLKELRDRALALQKRRGSLEEKELQELSEVRETIRQMGIGSPMRASEVEMLRDRVRQLEAANTLGQMPSIMQSAHPLTSRPGSLSMLHTSSSHDSDGPGDTGSEAAHAGAWETDTVKKKKSTLGKLRKGLSKVLKGGKTSRAGSGRMAGVLLEGGCPNSEQTTPRPSVPSTPRAAATTPALCATPRLAAAGSQLENDVPNIVIVNGMTQQQLAELLKGGPAFATPTHREAPQGEQVVLQELRPVPVPSYNTPGPFSLQEPEVAEGPAADPIDEVQQG